MTSMPTNVQPVFREGDSNEYVLIRGARDFLPRTVTTGGIIQILADDIIVLIAQNIAQATSISLPNTINQMLTIKDANGTAGTFNLTLVPTQGTIDGQANYVINVPYSCLDLYSTSNGWSII